MQHESDRVKDLTFDADSRLSKFKRTAPKWSKSILSLSDKEVASQEDINPCDAILSEIAACRPPSKEACACRGLLHASNKNAAYWGLKRSCIEMKASRRMSYSSQYLSSFIRSSSKSDLRAAISWASNSWVRADRLIWSNLYSLLSNETIDPIIIMLKLASTCFNNFSSRDVWREPNACSSALNLSTWVEVLDKRCSWRRLSDCNSWMVSFNSCSCFLKVSSLRERLELISWGCFSKYWNHYAIACYAPIHFNQILIQNMTECVCLPLLSSAGPRQCSLQFPRQKAFQRTPL